MQSLHDATELPVSGAGLSREIYVRPGAPTAHVSSFHGPRGLHRLPPMPVARGWLDRAKKEPRGIRRGQEGKRTTLDRFFAPRWYDKDVQLNLSTAFA